MAKAKWIKNEKRWKLRVQIDNKIHVFTSGRAGSIGKKECEMKYKEFCDKYLYEADYIRMNKKIDEVWEKYLTYCESRYGKTSYPYSDAERTGRLYVLPQLSGKRMNKLRLEDFQNVINTAVPHERTQYDKKVLSKKYLTTIRYNINAFIKWAWQNDYIDAFKGELYIPKDRPFYGKEVLQPEDLKRLFEPAPHIWYHSLFCFLALTGMRPGEALGLQIDDYNGNSVTIKRSVNNKNQITPGKNRNAQRIVPLCDKAKQIVDETIERNQHDGLDTKWIFCSVTGGPGCQNTMQNNWKRLKTERNLPGSTYSLRGTWISLFKNSMTSQQLKAVVGHSASMPTFEIYSKALSGELETQRGIIDNVMKELLD